MSSMFENFNEILRKKLISLYEDFIENSNKKVLKINAATITKEYANCGSHLYLEIGRALANAYKIEIGNISIDKAKKILQNLKRNIK